MDDTISWEERYKQLEAHHLEETKFLINKVEELENKIESLESDVYDLEADVRILEEADMLCKHNHIEI